MTLKLVVTFKPRKPGADSTVQTFRFYDTPHKSATAQMQAKAKELNARTDVEKIEPGRDEPENTT